MLLGWDDSGILGLSANPLNMLSDCINVIVYLECTFVIGLSATSQEMLSTDSGSRINPIKCYRSCVIHYFPDPLVRYTFTKYGQRNVQDNKIRK